MNLKNGFQLSLLSSALILAGCGGSSSESEAPKAGSPVPVVKLIDVSVDEKSLVSVSADIDTKTDTIAGYSWTVSSDFDITVEGTDTANITFTAPEVSANSIIDLSLTVTDSSGDSTTATSKVNVSQLTIPLTISGLATDSPIANAKITVNIGGRDITVDVIADSTGAYTVDLVLDDMEVNAFISIEARGVGEQSTAGLISLLGTAGQLSEQAGADGELTSDESFAVNVTNVTTAQYALAKLANNGEDFTSDEQLAEISEKLNYDEVMTLATAIKVAIDKAVDNADLALPDGIPDTLALVEAIVGTLVGSNAASEAANNYIQDVQDNPEFDEAQEEIFADENIVDTTGYVVPPSYYLLPPNTLSSGTIFYFNENGTGEGINTKFTWQESDGFISLINTEYETTDSVEYINLENDGLDHEVEVNVQMHDSASQIRRLSSNDNGDIVTLTTTSVKHYPQGEFLDEVTSNTNTYFALRDAAIKPIDLDGVTVAYLSTGWQEDINGTLVSADKFTFFDNGTGTAKLHDKSFAWKVNDGALEVSYIGEEKTYSYKLASEQDGTDFFVTELFEGDDKNGLMVGEGKVSAEYPQWNTGNIPGIYDYEDLAFDDPNDQFWFELHENGNAETFSSGDWDENGTLTADEVTTMYGQWSLDSEGQLVITRVREYTEGDGRYGGYSEACRSADTEGCALYHTRTWKLIGQTDEQFGLYHKHHFDYTPGTSTDNEDYITYDVRTLFRKSTAPIDIASLSEKSVKNKLTSKRLNAIIKNKKPSTKYSKLEIMD